MRLTDLSRAKAFLVKLLRIVILSLRGLNEDKCHLRASALTFFSLLAVVPIMAMFFGIARGFGFEKALERQLLVELKGQEEIVSWIINFAHALLENTKSGLLAGIGIIILFWTVILVLGNIENSFNDIWGIKKSRTVGRKITDYLSIVLICPVLLITSSTVTVLITSQVETLVKYFSFVDMISPAMFYALGLLPYCILWFLFTFMYVFMPNGKVNFISGALAGITAGTIYQIFQGFYINLQFYVANYNAIYGSFAALPLFMIWLQVSWLIVLFGAEISFAHQNVDTYDFETDCLEISHSFKMLLTLKIVHLLIKHFSRKKNFWNETQIAKKLEISIRLVRRIMYELLESGVISEVKMDGDKDTYYQPGLNPKSITIKYVINALENQGINSLPVSQSEELTKISECLKSFDDLINNSPMNRRLADI